jgi:mono/diheme cytochrome c family protein
VKKVLALALPIVLVLALQAQSRLAPPQSLRLSRPAPATTAVDRGREVYGRYGCAMCHGADGSGGFANENAETEGKVPGVLYVAEGYTKPELRRLLLDGTPVVGKTDPEGPQPPYRMPGWRGHMSDGDVADLVEYLWSLYPASEGQSWR